MLSKKVKKLELSQRSQTRTFSGCVVLPSDLESPDIVTLEHDCVDVE